MEARFVVLELPCCIQDQRCDSGVGHGNLDMEIQRLPSCPGLPAVRRSRPRFKAESGLSLEAAAAPRHHGVLVDNTTKYVGCFCWFVLILCLKCRVLLEFPHKLPFSLSYPVSSKNMIIFPNGNLITFYLLLVTVFDELWFVTCESVCVFQGSCCYMAAWINRFLVEYHEIHRDMSSVTNNYHSLFLYIALFLYELKWNEYLFL